MRFMKKQLTNMMVCALCVAALSGCASASVVKPAATASGSESKLESMPGSVLQTGVITSLDAERTALVIKPEDMTGEQGEDNEVQLNMDKTTPIVSASTGQRVDPSQLKEGTRIYAWVSPEYTSSLPPQTWAHAIVVDAEETVPMHVEVASIETKDSTVTIQDTSSNRWTIDQKNLPVSYEDGKEVGWETVKKGTTLLVWPSMVAVSKENVFQGEKVMVLGSR